MPSAEHSPQTLYDKVLQAHVVDEKLDGTILLYIGMASDLFQPDEPTVDLPLLMHPAVIKIDISCTR